MDQISDDPARNGEETTAPPPGMYWVKMQGLWALRPIVDLDFNQAQARTYLQPESFAGSTLEHQGTTKMDRCQQSISQSAGAACSAAALTEAAALTDGAGSARLERLAQMQGVLAFDHQHAQLPPVHGGLEQRQEGDATARMQPQRQTPPLLPPPPPQLSHDVPEPQGWPDWLLQWGRRVESGSGSDQADQSAPPSAPPSPPGTPQRSMVKVPWAVVALAPSPPPRPRRSRSPPACSGPPLGPGREPSPL